MISRLIGPSGRRVKVDLTGKIFGNLTVIGLAKNQNQKNQQLIWNCVCICNKETQAVTSSLTSGDKKSCGCK